MALLADRKSRLHCAPGPLQFRPTRLGLQSGRCKPECGPQAGLQIGEGAVAHPRHRWRQSIEFGQDQMGRRREVKRPVADKVIRSEEHTSELQSPMRNSYAVFCLK